MQMVPFMCQCPLQYQSAIMPVQSPFMNACPPSSSYMVPAYPTTSNPTPMMAAATPLPIAFTPLVQGIYPSVMSNSVSWMPSSSFIDALSTGPMPYRPPDNIFPNSISMVMPIPYGVPNPFIPEQKSIGYHSTNQNYPSVPSYYSDTNTSKTGAAFPNSSYSSTQSYSFNLPVTYASYPSMPSINAQLGIGSSSQTMISPNQGLTPPTSTVTAPTVSDLHQPLPVGVNGPMTQMGDQTYHRENYSSVDFQSQQSSLTAKKYLPTYETIPARIRPVDSFYPVKSSNKQQSLSKMRKSDRLTLESLRREPVVPPITRGELIYDSGWVSKKSKLKENFAKYFRIKQKPPTYTTTNGRMIVRKKQARVSFLPKNGLIRRRPKSSISSASEYDCAVCREERDRKRIKEHYGSSLLEPNISSPKNSVRNISEKKDPDEDITQSKNLGATFSSPKTSVLTHRFSENSATSDDENTTKMSDSFKHDYSRSETLSPENKLQDDSKTITITSIGKQLEAHTKSTRKMDSDFSDDEATSRIDDELQNTFTKSTSGSSDSTDDERSMNSSSTIDE